MKNKLDNINQNSNLLELNEVNKTVISNNFLL